MSTDRLTRTIDEIFDNHYFLTRLQQLMKKASGQQGIIADVRNLEDQYYTSEEDLIEQLSQTISTLCEAKTRTILNHQFINISEEIMAIKKQMFAFMDQQNTLTSTLKKEVAKLSEENKRKTVVSQVTNNVHSLGTVNSGIRFSRSNPTAQEATTGKSYYSQLSSLRKEVEELKQSIVNGEGVEILRGELNQFRIQMKVGLEGVKQQSKKNTVEVTSLKSKLGQQDEIKLQIEGMVKRGIKSQLSVVGQYAQEITEIKQKVEDFEEKLEKHSENHQEYLSSQLKSLWLVVNDVKRSVDSLAEEVGLNRSTDIII